MNLKQGKISITLACVLLGIMLAVQYRTTQDVNNLVNSQRADELAVKLKETERQKDALATELSRLKEAHGDMLAQEQINQLKYGAGLVDLYGKGVQVTIQDSSSAIRKGENPNLYLIHDEDLLKVVNELRAAGAEAIAINDQRLIDTSEIRCAGPTVTINGHLFSAPYVVKAIGDPQLLSSALNMRGGVVEALQYWGIQIQVKRMDQIEIPAYNGAFKREFAKVKEEEAQEK